MKDEEQIIKGRRNLLTNLGVAAVAGVAASAAQAQQAPVQFQPARHPKDAWLAELGGEHRVLVDSSTTAGGANALRFANNIINAHIDEYEGKASDYAMVVCFRHMSTPYGYNDAIWAKYGAIFSRNANPAPTSNPMMVHTPSNGDNSIPDSLEKGIQFAICNRATRKFSMALASATGQTAEAVYAELIANGIPNSRFVPAGVVAVTRAQEYGYSLLYSE